MRLAGYQIRTLSEEIVAELGKRGILRLNVPAAEAVAAVERGIADDLMVEDRLNDEVKEFLKQFSKEIESGKVDYKTMFDMVKKKLVRERGLVL